MQSSRQTKTAKSGGTHDSLPKSWAIRNTGISSGSLTKWLMHFKWNVDCPEIYRSSTGKVNVSVLFNQDTFWLSQQRMAELFGVTNADISYHLIQLDKSGEVHLSDCIKKILIPSEQWDEQGVTLYNLDVVRVKGRASSTDVDERLEGRFWIFANSSRQNIPPNYFQKLNNPTIYPRAATGSVGVSL
ncbi:MAG: hypothetical protein ACI3ZD_13635 [Prevotella sp.]